MSMEIDTSKSSFTEQEEAYLRQRPWMITPEIEDKLSDPDANEGEGSYEDMSKKQLRVELKNRDLDYSDANKDELIARLVEDDEAEDEEE